MSARFAFLDHPGTLAFSHRGGTSEWPENTLPAFQHSIDLGFRYLETDVHLSADGVLFAFHDDNLARTTGLDAYIGDLEAADLERLMVDGRAPIPRLEEILTTWPTARINVDAKSDASVLPLIEVVRARRAIDRVCLGSFVDRRIRLCRRELGPELCTSMGRLEAMRLLLAASGLADPAGLQAACAQLPARRKRLDFATPRLIEIAHEHDLQVHYWTIDEPGEMTELLDLGADGLMTDRPRILREVLIERGTWAARGANR